MSRSFRQLLRAAASASPPPTGGGARTWFDDGVPAEPTAAQMTTGSGIVRNCATHAEWLTACNAAQPGDVINITGIITGRNQGSATCRYDGNLFNNGTAANPIVITCSGSGEIRSEVYPVGGSGFPEGLLVIDTEHVHVRGAKIFGGQFAFRYVSSNGTAAAPVKLWHNDVSGSRDAAFYMGSASRSDGAGGLLESSYISCMYNVIRDSQGTVEFNEGIYVGVGTLSLTWQDDSHDIEIGYNDIYNHAGDGIDIKLGAYNIDIHHNKVHDVSAQFGSGITTGATNGDIPDSPNPSFDHNLTIRNNWVWNIGYDRGGNGGVPFGMYVAKPGTDVFNNIIWSLNSSTPRGISSGSYIVEGSQPIRIFNNLIVCQANPIVYFQSGRGTALNMQYSNNLSTSTGTGVLQVPLTDFVGPTPTITGADNRANVTADAGDGPGSGYIPKATATNIVGQASGTTPAVDMTGVSRPQGGASERGPYELIPA